LKVTRIVSLPVETRCNKEAEMTLVRYVALLAFTRIVGTHSHLVSVHNDVIMSCIDDPDISIRLQALDLCVAMVTSVNIASVVDRLLRQLRKTPIAGSEETFKGTTSFLAVEPSADSDGEDPENMLRTTGSKPKQELLLPEDYKINVICKILDMCSQGTYANIVDFDWYIDVLSQLAALVPPSTQYHALHNHGAEVTPFDTAALIGLELRNVAVRVKSVRPAATHAAEWLISCLSRESTSPFAANGTHGVLLAAVWIVGEYAEYLGNRENMLDCSLNHSTLVLNPAVLSAYLEAIPKIFSAMVKSDDCIWDTERKTMTSLLLARIVHFLESLSVNPSLEVQERAVEFLELMRLAVEAVAAQEESFQSPPLFLISVIPSLFAGPELNPVAPGAQKKVPPLDTMDLDAPLHHDLSRLLHTSAINTIEEFEAEGETELFYKKRRIKCIEVLTPTKKIFDREPESTASPTSISKAADDLGAAARRRTERRGRYKDDPFYIANEDTSSGTSTPFHDILKSSNGVDVDIDAIPIMNLDLGDQSGPIRSSDDDRYTRKRREQQKEVVIAADETFDIAEPDVFQGPTRAVGNTIDVATPFKRESVKKSLLHVDSSCLRNFTLEVGPENGSVVPCQVEEREGEEAEMAEALRKVEKLRLEMQRASERIDAGDDIPPDGTLVKKRRKKKPKEEIVSRNDGQETLQSNQMILGDYSRTNEDGGEPTVKTKQRRKKRTSID